MALITFYPYQRRWLHDASRFKIGMFARQTGKTFTTCAEIVRDCLKAEIEGQRTRWVILSRGERQAKEAVDEGIKPMSKAFYTVYAGLKGRSEPEYGEDEFRTSDGVVYKTQEVIYPSGSRITALPANPDTARGYSANVFLDEFAFHANSREIWKALFPVISKPGLRLRITSTPQGKGNKFYDLWTGEDAIWSRHRVDIHQAVAGGLPRDVAMLKAGMADEDAWKQEYELEFLDEASAWLSYDLINSVEHEQAGKPEGYQNGPCFVGVDIAARNDLFVIWVCESVGDVLWTREIIARKRISFAEQDALLDGVMRRYRVTRLCMDQTGMGEKPVEDAVRRYGRSRVEGVLFSGAVKMHLATLAKERFDDRLIRIPLGDQLLRADLHSLRKESTVTGAPRFVVDKDTDSHADRAWAGFLALYAASGTVERFAYHSARKTPPDARDHDRDDDDGSRFQRVVKTTAGFVRGCF